MTAATSVPSPLRPRLLEQLRHVEATGRISALVAFHASCKYLLMAHGRIHLRTLGRIVAQAGGRDWSDVIRDYRDGFTIALGAPAPLPSSSDALMHMFGYVSAGLAPAERADFLDDIDRLRSGELVVTDILARLHAWTLRFDEPYLRAQAWFQLVLDE